MIGISFAKWNSKHGYFLTWERIYRKGFIWTPICRIRKRYDSWFGYWEKPKLISWSLHDKIVIFDGIPSAAQVIMVIDQLWSLGLVSTGDARVSEGAFELFFESAAESIRESS